MHIPAGAAGSVSDSEDGAVGEEASDNGEAAGIPASHLHAAGTGQKRQSEEDWCILYVP